METHGTMIAGDGVATSPWESAESRFHALVREISADLLGAPVEALRAACARALSRLVECLAIDLAAIGLPDPATDQLRVTSVVGAGGPCAPSTLATPPLPWLTGQLRAHRIPLIVDADSELPTDARMDLTTLWGLGLQSIVLVPVSAGDRLLGMLLLGAAAARQYWAPPLVDRVRLISEIFAGAFLRRDHEWRLHASVAELEARRERLQAENERLREARLAREGFDDIVGESAALRAALFMAEQVAATDAAVLLQGETGTGKELIARAIHGKSRRRDRALIAVNCAALPPTLIESELFGHEKGAFTGAVTRKMGRFELADRGTLFLDEVGELPSGLQAKLLRVLQDGEFERLGSTVTRRVDARVIAASNRDLAAAAREGTFRSDLYYRLAVFPIRVPPLRARREDIPLLTWRFLGQLRATLGRSVDRVSAATMERLVRYAWPGNIRELRNVLERAVILSSDSTLELDDLGDVSETPVAAASGAGPVPTLAEVERAHVLRVLELCEWRVRGRRNAAEQLGLNASTLYSRMQKLGKGSKMTTWEGGMRVPMVVRWPGHIKPGTVRNEIFASLDWLPTFVNIAGGPKGDGLKKQIEAGSYPGIVKTTLDGVDQRDYLEGKTEKSARDTFFYYSSAHPSAVRYKNWKMYFAIAPETATGFDVPGVQTQFAAGMVNLKRDPFETGMGEWKKAGFWFSGALAGPVTAWIYDWNLLPIGQVLWLRELETYIKFPPTGSGELQPVAGHGTAQEGADPPEPMTRSAGD